MWKSSRKKRKNKFEARKSRFETKRKMKKTAIIVILLITAGVMAQDLKISKEEPLEIISGSMNINNKTKAVTYTGAVTIKHAGNILKADKVTILPDSDAIIAEKNIEFTAKNKTKTTGGYAEYIKSKKQLIMKENATLVSVDKEKVKTNVKADVMELYGDEDRAEARGNVEMSRLDEKVKCATAVLDNKKDNVVLEGNPVVTKLDDMFEGKKLTIYFGKKLLVAEENVKARFYAKGAGE